MRKLFLITASLVVAGSLFGYTWIGSYTGAGVDIFKTKVSENAPIEMEEARIRRLLDGERDQVVAHRVSLLEAERTYKKRREEARQREKRIQEEEALLRRLRASLKEDKQVYTFGGREYRRAEVIEDVQHRMERLRKWRRDAAEQNKHLSRQKRRIAQARRALVDARWQVKELARELDRLVERDRLASATEQVNGVLTEIRSRQSDAKEGIEGLRKRVREKELRHEAAGSMDGGTIDYTTREDVLGRLDDALAPETADPQEHRPGGPASP